MIYYTTFNIYQVTISGDYYLTTVGGNTIMVKGLSEFKSKINKIEKGV